jgi:hypothetical protein
MIHEFNRAYIYIYIEWLDYGEITLIHNSLPIPTAAEWARTIMSLCLPGSPLFITKIPFAVPRRAIYEDGSFIQLRMAKQCHECPSRSLRTSE